MKETKPKQNIVLPNAQNVCNTKKYLNYPKCNWL